MDTYSRENLLVTKDIIELKISVRRLSVVVDTILNLPNMNNPKIDARVHNAVKADELISKLQKQLDETTALLAAIELAERNECTETDGICYPNVMGEPSLTGPTSINVNPETILEGLTGANLSDSLTENLRGLNGPAAPDMFNALK